MYPTGPSRELASSSGLPFNAPDFSFSQRGVDAYVPDGVTPIAVRTTGEIQVRPANTQLGSNIEVEFTVSVAEDGFLFTTPFSSIDQDDSTLTLRTPERLAPNALSDCSMVAPLMYIYVTIWVARGAALESFSIASESLAIIIHPDVDLNTSNTDITTSSGNVSMLSDSPTAFASRHTTIRGGSNSISGTYPLYDILSISTTSGSIDVTVLPQEVSPTEPQPAALSLASNDGLIRSTVSTISVPDRNYTNSISSNSGAVAVTLLHGNYTSIHTGSASITADIYPYGFNGSRTVINTRSQSGQVDVTVNPSLSHPSDVMNQMSTNHRSLSGKYLSKLEILYFKPLREV